MIYLERIEYPDKLAGGAELIFKLSSGETYNGRVEKSGARSTYYVNIPTHSNDIIFSKLGLDKEEFVRDIVGYSRDGSWPEVDTLEHLTKVLDALLKVSKPAEEVKKKTDNEWSWLLD